MGDIAMPVQDPPSEDPQDIQKDITPQATSPGPLNFGILLYNDGRIDRLIDRPLEEYFAALPKASIAWIDYSTKTIPGRSSGSSRRPGSPSSRSPSSRPGVTLHTRIMTPN
jgi:magnesium transporter